MLWTCAFGLWGLSRQDSVWRDEAATWQAAQRSTAELWHMLANVDVVHGPYYLLMHVLFTCFGAGTTTLRLPSVLATAVAAACVAVIGRRLAGRWAGLAGGMAFGLLPAVQFHLQEGRPYALVTAGAAISTLLLTTVLQRPVRTRHWAAYGTAVLLTGLLNWLSLMILGAHLATLLWTRAERAVLARWVVAAGCGTIGVLPLVVFSQSQSGQVAWIPPLSWHMLIGPAVLLAIGGTGALLDRPRAGRSSATAVGLPLLAVPQLGLLTVSLVQPIFLDRYILYSMMGLALLIGTAVGTAVQAAGPRFPMASRWILPATLAVAVPALLPQSLAKRSPASRVDDVLAIASDVRHLKRPGNAVLFIPSLRRDTKAVTPDAFAGLRDITLAESPEEAGTLKGVETEPDRIRAALLAEQRVLLVTDASPVARPARGARDRMKTAVLNEYFIPVADKQTRGRRVIVYERRSTRR
ncbi:glycosyltransferase family 39 protein [Streptomyces lavenduligriseus]|uniref:Glycosyltransferase family 39 protein n=1 Tax=Streptomyces lavenduligriseus TaxID=67315 RepID=A0ABT0NT09_9ACTN|nr:glycosyltransferase family 39 protein [Streptomyces lavenduligriseus]MCL3994590.1 glycosyltransferase family 39 protein [Streptomyces lavenduligriseus]